MSITDALSYQENFSYYEMNTRASTPLLVNEDPLPTLLVRRNMSLTARAVYTITRPIFLASLYSGYFTSLYTITGYAAPVRLATEFLLDIGGEHITIPSSDGAEIQGMYFSFENFNQNDEKIFHKWKRIFADNEKITSIFEVDLQGTDLRELMRLPKEVIDPCWNMKKAAVHCLGAGTIFEMNPQYILQNLYRGLDHLAFNYRGIHRSRGIPSYEGTCNDAYFALKYVRDRLDCQNRDLTVIGTSMGGGPALFAARQLPSVDVVLDRTFSRLSEVRINSKLQKAFSYLAEKFYTYPNNEWIGKIEGKVCIIHAKEDSLIDYSHAERLIRAYQKDKMDPSSNPNYIEAAGGHGSRYGGDANYSWYSDGVSQEKFSRALTGSYVNDKV